MLASYNTRATLSACMPARTGAKLIVLRGTAAAGHPARDAYTPVCSRPCPEQPSLNGLTKLEKAIKIPVSCIVPVQQYKKLLQVYEGQIFGEASMLHTGISGRPEPLVQSRPRRRRVGSLPCAPACELSTEAAMHLLHAASSLLASSLDYEQTVYQVARLCVPTVADWCIIHLIDEDQSLRRLALAYGDPGQAALAEELERSYPQNSGGADGVSRVLHSGKSLIFDSESDATRLARSRDAHHHELLTGLTTRAAMIVPLLARGRILGAISFLATRAGRRFSPAHLRLAEELAHQSALAVDNARLHHQLQQAIQQRDEGLAAISHDLRTPLAKITAFAEMLEPAVATLGTVQPEAVAWLGRIGAATTQMARQIDELLDLAHLQAGRALSLHRTPTDLVALVEEEVSTFQKLARRHTFAVQTDGQVVVGMWDAPRLRRVLGNLLSNAVKYSPDGQTITIAVRALPPSTDAAGASRAADGTSPAGRVVLTVQDQGIGIPRADLPHLFERFHRGANVVGRIAGMGVGLTASKQIVDQHGGTLTVTSTEGSGTTVAVCLPCD